MADLWVLRLVQAYQKAYKQSDWKFSLYGHSADGQFTASFLVTHPDLVKRAVITTATTYPQPDPHITWPFGMGALEVDIEFTAGRSWRIGLRYLNCWREVKLSR